MLTENFFRPRTYVHPFHPQYQAIVYDGDEAEYASYPSYPRFLGNVMLQESIEGEHRQNIHQEKYEQDVYTQIIQRQREIEERKRYKQMLLQRERERQEYEQMMLERERGLKLRASVQRQLYERQRQAKARQVMQRRQAVIEAELKKQRQMEKQQRRQAELKKKRQMEEHQRSEDVIRRFLASGYLPHVHRQDQRATTKRDGVPIRSVFSQMKGANTEEPPSYVNNDTKLNKTASNTFTPTAPKKSSILIGGVEEVPIEEWDGDKPDSIWNNRRPSEGNWMEPVEGYMSGC